MFGMVVTHTCFSIPPAGVSGSLLEQGEACLLFANSSTQLFHAQSAIYGKFSGVSYPGQFQTMLDTGTGMGNYHRVLGSDV